MGAAGSLIGLYGGWVGPAGGLDAYSGAPGTKLTGENNWVGSSSALGTNSNALGFNNERSSGTSASLMIGSNGDIAT